MSQEKVDYYKHEKANRKRNLKRAKTKKAALTAVGTLLCVVVVGWIGYSGFQYFHTQNKENPTTTEIDMGAVTDYLNSLSSEESAE